MVTDTSDYLEMVRILPNEALDQVNLFQGHLNGVFVLRSAWRIRHPKLHVDETSFIS